MIGDPEVAIAIGRPREPEDASGPAAGLVCPDCSGALFTVTGAENCVPLGSSSKPSSAFRSASASGATLFMEPLETVEINNELIALNDDGTFTGYAAIFGNVDLGGDDDLGVIVRMRRTFSAIAAQMEGRRSHGKEYAPGPSLEKWKI